MDATYVLSKLAADDLARQADREQRQEQLRHLSDPREDTQKYLSSFNDSLTCIRSKWDTLQTSGSSSTTVADCDELLAAVVDLEKSTAEAAYYLPLYDLRQCTNSLLDLRQQVQSLKTSLQPKQKFSFRSKVTRSKPPAAAAIPAAAAGQLQHKPGSSTQLHGTQEPHSSDQQQQQQQEQGVNDLAHQEPTTKLSPHDLDLIQSGHGVMDRQGVTLHFTQPQLAGWDFVLANLSNCTIHLQGCLPALRMQNLSACTVIAGPVQGASFVNSVADCTFFLASHQVRIHHATSCTFCLRVRSRPIIEACKELRFGPLPSQHQRGSNGSNSSSGGGSGSGSAEGVFQQQQQQENGQIASIPDGAAPAAHSNGTPTHPSYTHHHQEQHPQQMGTNPIGRYLGAGNSRSSGCNANICSSRVESSSSSSSRPPADAAGHVGTLQGTQHAAPEGPSGLASAWGSSSIARLCEALAGTQLSEENELWCQVDDFGWVKSTPSPHWQALNTAELQELMQ